MNVVKHSPLRKVFKLYRNLLSTNFGVLFIYIILCAGDPDVDDFHPLTLVSHCINLTFIHFLFKLYLLATLRMILTS
jgi:hypothetical protein